MWSMWSFLKSLFEKSLFCLNQICTADNMLQELKKSKTADLTFISGELRIDKPGGYVFICLKYLSKIAIVTMTRTTFYLVRLN